MVIFFKNLRFFQNNFLKLQKTFVYFFKYWPKHKKISIWETKNLLTDADSSTDIFISASVKEGADSIFFCRRRP